MFTTRGITSLISRRLKQVSRPWMPGIGSDCCSIETTTPKTLMYWVEEEGSGVWSCIIKYRFPGELLRIALLPTSANWHPPPVTLATLMMMGCQLPLFREGSGKSHPRRCQLWPSLMFSGCSAVPCRNAMLVFSVKFQEIANCLQRRYTKIEAQKPRHNEQEIS